MTIKENHERERQAEKKAEEPAAPPVIEYPKMLYHVDGRSKTVQNKDEEKKAAAEGFADKPVSPEPKAEPTKHA